MRFVALCLGNKDIYSHLFLKLVTKMIDRWRCYSFIVLEFHYLDHSFVATRHSSTRRLQIFTSDSALPSSAFGGNGQRHVVAGNWIQFENIVLQFSLLAVPSVDELYK